MAEYDWALRTLNGDPVRLDAYEGEVLFLNMWASWCGPCVREMAGIQALMGSLAGEDVTFLLVTPEGPEPVRTFLRRYGYELPILLEAQEMPEAFRLRALPTTFVVDRRGRIVLRHRGATDWDSDEVRAFLRYLAEAS